MLGDISPVASSVNSVAPVLAALADSGFDEALQAVSSTQQHDEIAAQSRHAQDAPAPRQADHHAEDMSHQAQVHAQAPAPDAASHAAAPAYAAQPVSEPSDHLGDILRQLEAALAHKLGASSPESRIDPIDPVFLAAMAQLGQLAGLAANQHHAPRHAAAAEAAQQPVLQQKLLLPAELTQRLAAMPDRTRGAAFATLMAAIDRMPTINRTDALRKLLDGERHGGLTARSLSSLWSALNQARPDPSTNAGASYGGAPEAPRAVPLDGAPDGARVVGLAVPVPALEAARQQAALAAPEDVAAADPAGVDTTGLARFLRDIDDAQRPQYLALMLERAGPMPPLTRMALLRVAMQQANQPGCAPVLAGYVREQPRLQPIEQQGQAWSGMLRSAGEATDAELADALCRNIDLALGQSAWPDDLRRAVAMLAQIPAEARSEPMRGMLAITEHLPRPMRDAALAHMPPALAGLPESAAKSIQWAIAAQQALSFAAAPAMPGLSDLSGLSGETPAALPDPAANLRAFARALEAADYTDAEDPSDAGEDRPGHGAAGRPVGVVSFNRPGHPRFHTLMERLSREHPPLMEQDQRGYRQAVERALAYGPVQVGMSPRYPWPSSCDRDAEGGCLISINPNLLDCSLARIVAALVIQMRRAALGCAGDGTGLRGI